MLSKETLECFPTIEMMHLFPFPLKSAASSFLEWENCSHIIMLYSDSGCVVCSNSSTPGPDVTSANLLLPLVSLAAVSLFVLSLQKPGWARRPGKALETGLY